jgi:hypothetical protein
MSRLRCFVTCLLSVVAVLTSSPSWGWNSVGHLACAKLAFDRLSAEHRAKLFALLKEHPHYSLYLAFGRPADVDEAEWAVLRAAVWPDWVRPRRGDARGQAVLRHNHPEDHYVNVAIIDPKDAAAFAGKTLIPPDKANVISALKERCNDITNRTAAPEDKAIAICWLFHLAGDIHQPLHNAAYFSSEEGFQRGDEGGNKFGVAVNGRRCKLHMFWDELLGEDRDYADDAEEHQQRIFRDAMKVAVRLKDLQLTAAAENALVENVSFESWSRESADVARTVAYMKSDGSGILDHVLYQTHGGLSSTSAPEVGEAYISKARATADVRIVLAGRRLADRIKQLLNDSPTH